MPMTLHYPRIALASLALLAGCVNNPATGGKDFTPLMSPAQERAIGLQQHPQILAEYGGAYKDARIATYVSEVGNRMVANSELPNQQFTFTVLDSEVLNAFALPGGYVYISRQLLGLMNDEAELASVLGHEIGHVTARHAAKRYNNSVFGNLAAAGLGVLLGSPQLGQLAGAGVQLASLSYSRGQELQADSLGVRYITRAGYDPFAAADMLKSLGAQSSLDARLKGQDENAVPGWARTHPLSADRVVRAMSAAQQTGAARGEGKLERQKFLDVINGLLMDENPDQGFIRGQDFLHPRLRIAFTAPAGFKMANGAQAVTISGPSGQAQFGGGALAAGQSLEFRAAELWSRLVGEGGQAPPQAKALRVHEFDAVLSVARLQSNNGLVDVELIVIRPRPGEAFHFIMIAPAGRIGVFDSLIDSFRLLRDGDLAALRERRIKVITVAAGDTPQSLAQRMAYRDDALGRFLTLNGLSADVALTPGQRVKLIVEDKID